MISQLERAIAPVRSPIVGTTCRPPSVRSRSWLDRLARLAALAIFPVSLASCGGGGSSAPPPPPPPAAPTIASLTPAAATAGGSNFVLTVTGTGFVATSVIQWNGSARATTFVTSTSLQAPIPATDIATPGSAAITVVNPSSNGGTSNSVKFPVNNPAPTISSLSPTFVAPGGPAFVLTVNGAGFIASSRVRWNGADRTTTLVSATQLSAAIPASDIASQGTAQVTVFNPSPGGGTSGAVTVAIGNPIPQVTQLVPAVVRPGGPDFTLYLAGTGFVTGATVTWNGVALPTTFVSQMELHVAVPAGNISAKGSAQVVAVNPGPGGGASNTATLNIAPYGVIERASVATDGSESNGSSDNPSISANGRFVAFSSSATNLAAGDTNGVQDIFLRDTCFGVASGCTPSTQRVSLASDGSAANGASDLASISADGRYVAFTSDATNLVPGDTNGVADIFVRDTCASVPSGCTPTTSRVSVASDGSQGNLASASPSISANGRFVAFVTGSILVLGDINGASDAFVRDTCAGVASCTPSTVRISTITDGLADNRGVVSTTISADGRYVAFVARQKSGGGNDVLTPVYTYDTCLGAPAGCSPVAVLAVSFLSPVGELLLNDRSLSADGRFVVYRTSEIGRFTAQLTDSCIGATPGCTTTTSVLADKNSGGPVIETANDAVTLTADGRFASFGQFIRGNPPYITVGDTCIAAPAGCTLKDVNVSESADGSAANNSSLNSTLSADGSRVAFSSDATNLVPGDVNGLRDIFVARTGLSH